MIPSDINDSRAVTAEVWIFTRVKSVMIEPISPSDSKKALSR